MVEFVRRHKFMFALAIVMAAYFPRFIRQEFALYPLAAQALLEGKPLETVAPGFTYPPFFAFCMIPFVWMPIWLRGAVWYGATVASILLCFRLCERLCVVGEWKPRELFWLRLLTLLLSLKVTLSVLENRAYDSIVFLMALIGLLGVERLRQWQAGTGFAMAAALKATPLLFFPYLWLRGQWKTLLLGVGLFVCLSCLPDVLFRSDETRSGYFVAWIHNIAGSAVRTGTGEGSLQPVRQWEEVNALNQSLRSTVQHLTAGTSFAAYNKTIQYVVYLVYLLIVTGLLIWPRGVKRSIALDGSVVLISMLMLSPMSSKSHYVVLMLPYMAATAWVIREKRFRWVGGVLLGFSFALITLTSRDLIGKPLANCCLSAGCVTFGALVLLTLVGYLIVKRAS